MSLSTAARAALENTKTGSTKLYLFTLDICRTAWLPFPATKGPLSYILNTTESEQDDLTLEWRNLKINELNTITLTGALIAATVTGALAWPITSGAPWTVKALWMCALLNSLFTVAVAVQQNIGLSRLGSYPQGLQKLRDIFSGTPRRFDESSGKVLVTKTQVYVWQAPATLLGSSMSLFLLGLATALYSAAAQEEFLGPDKKIAVCFSVTVICMLIVFLVSWGQMEWKVQALARTIDINTE